MKWFHWKYTFLPNKCKLKTIKLILYHKKDIKQIEYGNKVRFFLHFFAFWTIIDYVLYVINLSMKKVLIQFKQRILKYRKRLIYGVLALFIGQICFFDIWGVWVQNEIFAANNETSQQREGVENIVKEKLSMVDFFRKAIYILVYPLLFLAGKLVDNSFVYWEVFLFDSVLWKLWNIVRNLTNFTLWFMFVYYVFKYLITKDGKKGPKWLIKNALIAWVWIQASWFIMSVVIDISTILTYSIWGLPISVLWWEESWEGDGSKYDPYVMKTIITVDANDVLNYKIYSTPFSDNGSDKYISECDTFQFKGSSTHTWVYILAPKMIYYRVGLKDYRPTSKDYCSYFGQIYHLWESHVKWESCSDEKDCDTKQNEYNAAKKNKKDEFIGNPDKLPTSVLKVWDKAEGGIWWDEDNMGVGKEFGSKRLSELMKDKNTKSYVWVFTALYSSLLEAWRWIIPDDNESDYVQFLSWLLSLWHTLAIAIPLVAAIFVFMMRIGIIWVAIVWSPIIILLETFDLFGDFSKKSDSKFLSYFKIENLIWIIFSPAVICFAISMSTVLVRLIEKIDSDKIFTEPLVLWWIIKMDLAWFSVWVWKLIIAVMGVAITWFLVWTAIELSELWKSDFVKNLKWLASTYLWSIPVVPVPVKKADGSLWTEMMWVNTVFGLDGQKWIIGSVRDNIRSKVYDADNTALNQFLNPEEYAEKAEKTRSANRIQWYVDGLQAVAPKIMGKWTEEEIWEGKMRFSALSDSEKENIINKINQDKSLIEVLGKNTQIVTIWDKTYTYDENKKIYESKSE